MQEQRDREAKAQLEAKLMEKLARADIIAEQRHSIAEELQRMRKDIAQQEAWVKVSLQPVHLLPVHEAVMKAMLLCSVHVTKFFCHCGSQATVAQDSFIACTRNRTAGGLGQVTYACELRSSLFISGLFIPKRMLHW